MTALKVALSVDSENPDVGDLYLENGTVHLTTTLIEEVAQRLFVSLKMFKGEWFLDPSQGVPYWQSILGIKQPLSVVTQIFRQAVAQQPGISRIDRFTATPQSNRGLLIEFQCVISDGTVLSSADFAPFIVGA